MRLYHIWSPGEMFQIHLNLQHHGMIGKQLEKNMKTNSYKYRQHFHYQCLSNEWILPLTVVTCPPPDNIDRGYMSVNDQRDYDYMEAVKYGCNGEYVLEGSLQIVCQQNGKWSEKPSCKGTFFCLFFVFAFLANNKVCGLF